MWKSPPPSSKTGQIKHHTTKRYMTRLPSRRLLQWLQQDPADACVSPYLHNMHTLEWSFTNIYKCRTCSYSCACTSGHQSCKCKQDRRQSLHMSIPKKAFEMSDADCMILALQLNRCWHQRNITNMIPGELNPLGTNDQIRKARLGNSATKPATLQDDHWCWLFGCRCARPSKLCTHFSGMPANSHSDTLSETAAKIWGEMHWLELAPLPPPPWHC